MNVGLPGTGIGGLFYLLIGLAMPLHELAFTLRGRSSAARWRVVLGQFGIAAGCLVSLTLAGAVLAAIIPRIEGALPAIALRGPGVYPLSGEAWLTPLLVSFATLAAVLVGVQLLRGLARAGVWREPSAGALIAARPGRCFDRTRNEHRRSCAVRLSTLGPL